MTLALVLITYCFVSVASIVQSNDVASLGPHDSNGERPLLKPTITGPQSQTVVVGGTAIFNCKVLYSHLPYHIQWLKHYMINGSSWSSNGEPYATVLQSGANPKQLIISNVTMDDAGSYSCVVSNAIGYEAGSARLTVIEDRERQSLKPTIKGPQSQTVVVGDTAIFNCKVLKSHLPYHIQWMKHYMINGSWKGSDGEPYINVLHSSSNPEQLIISNVTMDNAGSYSCVVSNEIGYASGNAWLTVIEDRVRPSLKPTIKGPQSQTVVVGDTAIFNCKVLKSHLPYHIQWMKHYMINGSWKGSNGEPYINVLHSSSNPEKLIISNVTMDNAGSYSCVVSNKIGYASGNAWLTVIEDRVRPSLKPTIKGPESQKVVVGETAIFNCKVVQSHLPYHIEWLKHYMVNGSWKSSDGQPYVKFLQSGANPEQLIISNVTMDNAGLYSCVVSNEIGYASGNAWLTVIVDRERQSLKPTIKGPQNQTVEVGDTALFNCRVLKSHLPYHIQWFKHYMINGSWKDSDEEPYLTVLQRGANPEQLIISNVTMDNAGFYSCIVSNKIGYEYGTAWLTVIEDRERPSQKPIIQGPQSQTVVVGDTVIFNCKVVQRHLPYHIQWLKHYMINDSWRGSDGEPYVKVLQIETNPEQFIISNVTLDDAGWYSCVASNAIGYEAGNAWLTVEEYTERHQQKMIIKGPQNQTVAVGDRAIFNCKVVQSHLPYHIQWLKHYMINGSWRDSDEEPYVKVLQIKTNPEQFIISNVTVDDAGLYSCVVSNAIGYEAGNAWLTVEEYTERPPQKLIIKGPQNQMVAVGYTAIFNCEILLNDLPYDIEWMKYYMINDSWIDSDRKPYRKIVQNGINNSNPEQLIISNVTMDDEGRYSCFVSNDIGIESDSAWLTVIEKTVPLALIGTGNGNVLRMSALTFISMLSLALHEYLQEEF